jgi:hypothetical protein
MQFRPSALSNPNLQRVEGGPTPSVRMGPMQVPTERSWQRVEGGPKPSTVRTPKAGSPIIAELTDEDLEDEDEKKEDTEGLSMPVKVAIGLGVAGVLGFLVFKLVK